jgi:hypothetical protein
MVAWKKNAASPGAKSDYHADGARRAALWMQHREAIMDESARAELIAALHDTVTFAEGLLVLNS